MHDSSCIFEIIQQVQKSEGSLSVKELCRIAGVSRSGYYAWVKASPIRERLEEQDRQDFDLILTAYKMHGYTKGAKGIYMAPLHMDPPIIMNLKKIRRIMDKFNLSCPIRKANPYRKMAKALRTNTVAENLLQREFECYGPRNGTFDRYHLSAIQRNVCISVVHTGCFHQADPGLCSKRIFGG